MGQIDEELLRPLAAKYIWWKTPDEAVQFPDRIIAQVMDIGDYDDLLLLIQSVGEDYLREVLTNAEAGQFRPKSWHYWHYRLGLSQTPEQIPPMPKRKVS